MKIVKEEINESKFKAPSEEEVANNLIERADNYFLAYMMAEFHKLYNVMEIIKRKIFEDPSPLLQIAEEIWGETSWTPDEQGRFLLSVDRSQDLFKIVCENNFKSKKQNRTFNISDYQKYYEYIGRSDIYLSKHQRVGSPDFLTFRIPIAGFPMNGWAADWIAEYMPSIKIKDRGRDNYDLIIGDTGFKGELSGYEEGRVTIHNINDITVINRLSFPQFVEFAKYILNNKLSKDIGYQELRKLTEEFKEKEFNHVPEDFTNDDGEIFFDFSDELINKVLEYFKQS